ncbi:hypothetical protein [Devosia sp.]|jgi:hypothetical protein|uniref:hypothetical protein n=1 Tax=Devosia sp. TaxID=1871048 RepID=UPI003EE92946
MMGAPRAIRRDLTGVAALSPHRRGLAQSGAVQAFVHEGHNFAHCLELRTTGALGTLLLSRQNLDELKRVVDAAEEAFDALDDRDGSPFLRGPQKLTF